MKTIKNGSIKDFINAATNGPLMKAEIVALNGNGKLRTTCNWLYSALNCNPDDNCTFEWQFNKIDDTHISLSPVSSCIGQTIYASIRPDYNYRVQVQAPFSADWITAVGGDEIIGFTLHDLSIGQLNGLNGKYISVDNTLTSHSGYSSYLVASNQSSFDTNARWFIKVSASLQPNLVFEGQDTSKETIKKQMQALNIPFDANLLNKIALQIK